jgi:hypothetical protein
MNIAICISGQPRCFQKGFESLTKNILNNYNSCDIFIHTWFTNELVGVTFDTTHQGSRNKVGTYEPNTIEQILERFKPKSFLVDKPKTFNWDLPFTPNNLRDGVQPNNVYSMFYSIYKSIQLKTEYEMLHNLKYDVVVRTRFDLSLPEPLLFDTYDLNTIVVPQSNNTSVVYDIFGFSNSNNMNCYGNTFINIEDVWSPDKHFIGEQLLTDNIKKCNIPVTPINYRADLYRA